MLPENENLSHLVQVAIESKGWVRESLCNRLFYSKFAPASNFLDGMLDNGENLVPGETGQSAVDFLDPAYQSAAGEGIPVDVNSPDLGPGRRER